MQLQVLGKPTIKASGDMQSITVRYNPDKDYTIIHCDVDVVTLGIAMNVLKNLYNEALQKVDAKTANEIMTITERAVICDEEH